MKFAFWYIFSLCGVLLIAHAQAPDPVLEAECRKHPGSHVFAHPRDCESYVECHAGFPLVRTCGAGLHFNTGRRVCDYPKVAGCRSRSKGRGGPGTLRHTLPPPGHPGYTRPPPPRRPPPPHTNKPTYQETVYGGAIGRPGDLFRGYERNLMMEAKNHVNRRMKREVQLYKDMYNVVDSAPYQMVSKFLNAKPYAKKIAQPGMALLYAMKIWKKRFHLDGDIAGIMKGSYGFNDVLKPLPGVFGSDSNPLPLLPDIDYCPYPRLECDASARFRTVDGSCNNLARPIIGRSLTPFRRALPALYDDGIETARRSVSGRPLPGARFISNRLFPDADLPVQKNNMMMVFWGQLIDHDLTLTAITEVPVDGSLTDTKQVKCGFDGCQTGAPGLESCWPIPVPEDDSDFPFNRCLKFVRAVEVPALDCQLGPRQQLNQATHWMDGSMVYGTTEEEGLKLRDLRDRDRGRMAARRHPESGHFRGLGPVLPPVVDNECRDVNRTHSCFLAGDERVNENAGLTVYHTALIREHNRIEAALHRINPHWNGERLYQETRRIVVAMIQHITFNEWLPLIVGPEAIRRNDLDLLTTGYYFGYDREVDGTILNEFATAAFRFGHTLLQERLRRADVSFNFDDSLFLSETLFRPIHSYDVANGGIDGFARGLANFPCQSYDQFFTKQVTKSLFTENPPFGPGMDLLSLNIQRGRDHGLRTYNDMREWCGLGRAKTFDDLTGEIQDHRALDSLRDVYEHVDDIDIFPGGISERTVPGGMVGPTFACIFSDTFRRLRSGDRFWYENNLDGAFTPGQLQEIRKSTISKIICKNLDNVSEIQKWLFMVPTPPNPVLNSIPPDFHMFFDHIDDILGADGNPRVHCDSLPEVDLTLWTDAPF